MAKVMKFRCKNPSCGKVNVAPIQMDERSFATATLTNNGMQCQHCRQMATYSKEDHFFEEE